MANQLTGVGGRLFLYLKVKGLIYAKTAEVYISFNFSVYNTKILSFPSNSK